MSVYTKTGDKGNTSLFSGERIKKYDDKIDAYGSIDELNSFLGGIVSALPDGHTDLSDEISTIQQDLMLLGGWLAVTPGSKAAEFLDEFEEKKINDLEKSIDKMEESLEKLTKFILPGGHLSSSFSHIARCVCRRAERKFISLMDKKPDMYNDVTSFNNIQKYINRLSDYLFVLARYCNKINDRVDIFSK